MTRKRQRTDPQRERGEPSQRRQSADSARQYSRTGQSLHKRSPPNAESGPSLSRRQLLAGVGLVVAGSGAAIGTQSLSGAVSNTPIVIGTGGIRLHTGQTSVESQSSVGQNRQKFEIRFIIPPGFAGELELTGKFDLHNPSDKVATALLTVKNTKSFDVELSTLSDSPASVTAVREGRWAIKLPPGRGNGQFDVALQLQSSTAPPGDYAVSGGLESTDGVPIRAEERKNVFVPDDGVAPTNPDRFYDGFEDGNFDGWSAIETPEAVNDRNGNDWAVITNNPISGSSSLRVNTLGDWDDNGIATDEYVVDMTENFDLSFDWRAGGSSRGVRVWLLAVDGTNFENTSYNNIDAITADEGIALLMSGKRITSADTGKFAGTSWGRSPISAGVKHSFEIRKRGDSATLYLDGGKQVSGSVRQDGTYRLLIQSSGYFGGSSTLILDDITISYP